MLAGLGRVVHAQTELPLGALGVRQPLLTPLAPMTRAGEITIAVVGAHLSGMPLNGELRALNARFVEEADTAPDYALYALAGTTPPKPGLLRVADGKGAPIALEVWALSAENFGRFVAGDSRAAVDRNDPPCGRQTSAGLSGGAGGGQGRARHFGIRRLARLCGARRHAAQSGIA